MNFDTYLRCHYQSACNEQRRLKKDFEMVAMLRCGKSDLDLVRSWMQEYRLFQGITGPDRLRVAKAFLKFARSNPPRSKTIDEAEIKRLFSQLFTILFRTVERGWVSATSKLLWCLYPDDVVICDAFVWRSLVVMQAMDKEMSRLPRIGSSPEIEGVSDIAKAADYYALYGRMVKLILNRHKISLQVLRKKYKEAYPYDIRIVDKLLWMVGNPSRAF